VNTENLEIAKEQYQAGKTAFERGDYRQSVQALEKAVSLAARNTRLGGEMQIWLVTAYQAAGQQQQAIGLCEQLSRHPDLQTRKQAKRLLFILQAPQLKTRPEWLTEIPDLGAIDDAAQDNKGASQYPATPRRSRSQPEPEPVDLTQVNTKDNQFIWVALIAIALMIGGLLWLS
jgi:tetratricopeptide (TPR) repeat protein